MNPLIRTPLLPALILALGHSATFGQATIAPELPTQCPVIETACPAGPTWCPTMATVCPATPTVCPVQATQCPVIPNECGTVSPTISNLRAAQRTGTNLVDIDFDISGTTAPLHVSLHVSTDDGLTYTIPATSVSGAAGPNITPAANLRLTWDAGKDWGGRFSDNIRYRIVADDDPPPEGFVRIPAGSFTMGRTTGDTDTDAPPVTVYVSEFQMARHEVTKALWDDVRAWGLANGYTDLPAGGGKAANHPVHSINWHAMVKWCNARSEKDNLSPCYTLDGSIYRTGNNNDVACNWFANGYRLPTEAEWEKAARGGLSGLRFPWSDSITHNQANYRVVSSDGTTNLYSYDTTPRPPGSVTNYDHPTYVAGGTPYTSPVGSFRPSGYGLYDMAGNVWEWCWDWYLSTNYSDGATDPRGPVTGSNRVTRGGGWTSDANRPRCARRVSGAPTYISTSDGFRLVRGAAPVP